MPRRKGKAKMPAQRNTLHGFLGIKPATNPPIQGIQGDEQRVVAPIRAVTLEQGNEGNKHLNGQVYGAKQGPLVPQGCNRRDFEGPAPRKATLLCWLTGRQFYNASIFLTHDDKEVQVQLAREPDNSKDPNAIIVRNLQGDKSGYVEMKTSQFLSPLWDGGHVLVGPAFVLRPKNLDQPRHALMVVVQVVQTTAHPPPVFGFTSARTFRKQAPPALEILKRSLAGRKLKDYTASKKQHTRGPSNNTSYVQNTLSAPKLFKKRSRDLTGTRWEQAAFLEHVFQSGALDFFDVWGQFRLVSKHWKGVTDRVHFMKYQEIYWRINLCKSPPKMERASSIEEFGKLLVTVFPWIDSPAILEFLASIVDSDCWKHILSECAGVAFLLPLLLGGAALRRRFIKSFLPQSYLQAAQTAWSRHDALEVVYFVTCVLFQGPFSSQEKWRVVRDELEHNLHLFGSPQGYVIQNAGFSSASSIHLTSEQLGVIQADIKTNTIGKVYAFAGSGKTTTLLYYTRCRPSKRFLYLAFNTSVREEAERMFPSNVKCVNFHKLAFRHIGWKYQKQLEGELAPHHVSKLPPLDSSIMLPDTEQLTTTDMAQLVINTLMLFLRSRETLLEASFAIKSILDYWRDTIDIDSVNFSTTDPLVIYLEARAKQLWGKMRDHNDIDIPMIHDGYLKLYQLAKPNLSRDYDVVILDEAQDASPSARDVVMQQSCGRLLVGDQHQAIYSFLGAENALDISEYITPETKVRVFRLSKCFRFGPEVATIANGILTTMKGPQRQILVGSRSTSGRGIFTMTPSRALLATYHATNKSSNEKVACISRTNRGVIYEALGFVREFPNRKFAVIGELGGFSDLLDVLYLYHSKISMIKNTRIKQAKSFPQLVQSKPQSISWALTLLEQEDPGTLFQDCKRILANREPWENSNRILTTAHKAKGLEFDTVLINNDFQPFFDSIGLPARVDVEEVNILYVAVTRAKTKLLLTPALQLLIAKHDFLSEPTLVHPGAENICEACKATDHLPRILDKFPISYRPRYMQLPIEKFYCNTCKPFTY
mmetsp:Transcript_359/g.399  ORF Transcript_359/g.399 Transcript_359/m.399 type:complete len:1047 (-) Transcript_359:284-3424(-)